MARKLRIEYEGAVYHVMNRGDRRRSIFKDDHDRTGFLEAIGQACDRTGWRIHAYVLMDNHFHVLLETPEANLVAGMKWLLGSYTQRFNLRHRQVGHLFQGRYKAIPVSSEDEGYFDTLSSYIHLNPARAGIVLPEDHVLSDYPWSSYPLFLAPPGKRPDWLCTGWVLADLGLQDDRSGRRHYREYMEGRFQDCGRRGSKRDRQEWESTRRGWYLGGSEFKDELLGRMEKALAGRNKESHSGEAKREHDEREAERLIVGGLKVLGISSKDLEARKKSDPAKCVLAWLVRTRTSVGAEWVSRRLDMGHRSAVSNAVRRVTESKEQVIRQAKQKVLL